MHISLLGFPSELPDVQSLARRETASRGSSRSSSKSRPKSRSRSRSKSSERILLEKDQSYCNEEFSGETRQFEIRLIEDIDFQVFISESIRSSPGYL